MNKYKRVLSLFLALIIAMSSMVSVSAAAIPEPTKNDVAVHSTNSPSAISQAGTWIKNEWSNFDAVERVNSMFNNIKKLDFVKGNIDLNKRLENDKNSLERIINSIKAGFIEAKLKFSNFVALANQVVNENKNSTTTKVEYGVSSTYTVTVPTHILATKPGSTLNVYEVSANDVVIPYRTELGVSVVRDGYMLHHDDESVKIDYNMYKQDATSDKLLGTGGARILKVPAGFTEGDKANIFATISESAKYAGVYEEGTVIFNLKVTDHTYTEEELEQKEEAKLVYKIGKTKPEYVIAEFNDTFTTVTIFPNNELSDGLMMDWETAGETTNPFYAHKDTLTTVVFGGKLNKIKSVGKNAFNGCDKITGSVTIPNTIESIGEASFKNCSSISEVNFEDAVVEKPTQKSAFRMLSNVSAVPKKPVVYGNAKTRIGTSAFSGCSGLGTVKLGNTISYVGDYAFSNCLNMKEFNSGASCSDLGDEILKGNMGVDFVVLPNVTNFAYHNYIWESSYSGNNAGSLAGFGGENTTIIFQSSTLGGDRVENGGFSIVVPKNSKVIFGNTVKRIGATAFMNTLADSFTFEDGNAVDYIGPYAFENIGKVYEMYDTGERIVNSVIKGLNYSNIKNIKKYAFYGCDAIQDNEMNFAQIKEIGEDAFANCKNLKLDRLTFGANLETIDCEAFAVNYEYNKGKNRGPGEVGYSYIKEVVFDNCKNAQIKDPERYTFSSDVGVFTNCGITNVDFKESKIDVGSEAFFCNNIENLVVPNTIVRIGSYGFKALSDEDDAFKTITFKKVPACETVPEYVDVKGTKHTESILYEWTTSGIFSMVNLRYDNTNQRLDNPINVIFDCDFVGGRDLASTYKEAPYFISQYQRQKITFTDKVKTINAQFDNSVRYWEPNGDKNSTGIIYLNLGKNIEYICDGAFASETGYWHNEGDYFRPDMRYHAYTQSEFVEECFHDLIVPDACKYIGNNAFTGIQLKSIKIGNNIETIGSKAFYGQKYMKGELLFSDKCKSIGTSAFEDCILLTKLSLPNTVARLGTAAFKNCKGLVGSVTLPLNANNHQDLDGDKLCDICGVSMENELNTTENVNINFNEVTYQKNNVMFNTSGEYKITFVPDKPLPKTYEAEVVLNTYTYSLKEEKGNLTFTAFLWANQINEITLKYDSLDLKEDVHFNIKYELIECHHTNIVTTPGVTPKNCKEVGKSISYKCPDCGATFGGGEYYGNCEDKDKNGTCDICGLPMSDFKKNEISWFDAKFESNTTVDKVNWLTFVPKITDTYVLNSTSSDVSLSFFEKDKKTALGSTAKLMANTEYQVRVMNLKANVTTCHIGVKYEVCKHKIVGKIVGSEESKSCTQAGTLGCISCLECNTTLMNSSSYYAPHNFVDGKCTVCRQKEPDNKTSCETIIKPRQSKTIKFTSSQDDTYNFDFNTGNIMVKAVKSDGTEIFNNFAPNIDEVPKKTYEKLPIIKFSCDLKKGESCKITIIQYNQEQNINCSLSLDSNGSGSHGIGTSVFEGCNSITQVDVSDVHTIPARTFYGCSSLKKIISNEKTRKIDDSCFAECTQLKDGVKPFLLGVETVGYRAFYKCSSIDFTFDKTLSNIAYIDNYAFAYCSNLKGIEFADSVEHIGQYAFLGCNTINKVNFGKNTEYVGERAFKDCTNLTSVVGSKNSFATGAYAFDGCYNLTNVVFPEGITAIGTGCFYATGLKGEFKLPSSITKIGNSAFERCGSLTAVSGVTGVTEIGDYAFYKCGALKGMTNLTSCKKIGIGAFSECVNLVTFEAGDVLETISADAFRECEKLTHFKGFSGTKTIGESAFSLCYELKSALFGNNITSIGSNAFSWCRNLRSITIPNSLTNIGSFAFYCCSSLITPIVIRPNMVVDYEAFSGCSSINSLTIEDGVKVIEDSVFYGCSSLPKIDIPESVKTIGFDAFNGCSSADSIIYIRADMDVGSSAFRNCSNIPNAVIESGVKVIPDFIFEGCTKLQGLVLPSSVTVIGDYSFANSGITKLETGNNIAFVGIRAFEGCFNLETANLPNSIETIGKYVFNGCSKLSSCSLPAIFFENSSGGLSGTTNLKTTTIPDGTSCLAEDLFFDSGIASINIPGSVVNVGRGCFGNASSLSNVVLNEGLAKIEPYAFSKCTSLENISFPNSLRIIGDFAFTNSKSENTPYTYVKYTFYQMNLKNIKFGTGLTTIGDNAFAGNNFITGDSLVFPSSLESIGEGAFMTGRIYSSSFKDCIEVDTNKTATMIDLSKTKLTKIPNFAFAGFSAVANIKLPENLLSIGEAAFCNCFGVETINFPDTLNKMESYAFYGCQKLKSFVAPKNLTDIPRYAFYNCIGMNTLTLGEQVKTVQEKAFYGFKGAELNMTSSLDYLASDAFGDVTRDADGAIYIGKYLVDFQNIKGLKSYTVKEGTITVAENAFIQDKDRDGNFMYPTLEEIILPDSVVSIKAKAFNGLGELKNFVFSKNLSYVGKYAFGGTGVPSMTLNVREGVTKINAYAFSGCLFGGVNLPQSLEEIQDGAFEYCPNITKEIVIPNKTIKIGNNAFLSTKIVGVTIPDSVKEIGNYAFSETALKTLVVPNAEIIGESAFHANTALTDVSVSCKELRQDAFSGCPLTNVTLNCDRLVKENAFGYNAIIENLTLQNNSTSAVEFNAKIKAKNVHTNTLDSWFKFKFLNLACNPTHENSNFFVNGEKVTNLVVPASVKTLYSYSLAGKQFTDIYIPDETKNIEQECFFMNGTINSLNVPSLGLEEGGSDNRSEIRGTPSYIIGGNFIRENSSNSNPITPIKKFTLRSGLIRNANRAEEVVLGKTVGSSYMNLHNTKKLTIENPLCELRETRNIKDTLVELSMVITANSVPLEDDYYGLPQLKTFNVIGDNPEIPKYFFGKYMPNLQTINGMENVVKFQDYIVINWNFPRGIQIRISDKCKSIGANALSYFDVLSADLKNCEFIGEGNFDNNLHLTKVDLSSCDFVGYEAFMNCSNITTVVMPQKACHFRYGAFCGTNINHEIYIRSDYEVEGNVFGSLINEISKVSYENGYDYSFSNSEFENTKVNTVYLQGDCNGTSGKTGFGFENSVKHLIIDETTDLTKILSFSNRWTSLEDISLSGENPCHMVSTGVLYNKIKDANGLVTELQVSWVPKKIAQDIIVPEGCKSIGGFGDTLITGLSLPKTTETINYAAFDGCSALKTFTIPKDSSLKTINNWAFRGCLNMDGEINITPQVTEIGMEAFSCCKKLRGSVTINDTITFLGYSAFNGCSSLNEINVTLNNDVPNNLFNGCENATGSITLLDGVKRVATNAFANCKKVTSITFPNTLERIEVSAFMNTSSNTSDIVIPETCTDIGEKAFLNDTGVSNVKRLVIPKTLLEFGNGAFAGLCGLTTIECATENPNFSVKNGDLCNKKGNALYIVGNTATGEYTIPDYIRNIKPYAFAYNNNITGLTIPVGTKYISEAAFEKMGNLTSLVFAEGGVEWIDAYGFAYNTKLTGKIQLPNSLMHIGDYAFAGCTNIGWIGVGINTQSIGSGVFEGVPNATLDPENTYLKIENGEFVQINPGSFEAPFVGKEYINAVKYKVSPDGKTLTFYGDGEMVDWNMGDNYNPPTSLVDKYSSTIETIVVEDGVTSVGAYAFITDNTNIKKIVLGKDVSKIGDCAFVGCNGVDTIEISPNNTNIKCENGVITSTDDKNVFLATKAISPNYQINSNAEYIAGGCFANTNIESIVLPENITMLNSYTFKNCFNLNKVDARSVSMYGDFVFQGCLKLKEIILNLNIPLVTESSLIQSITDESFAEISNETPLKITIEGKGDAPRFTADDISNMISDNSTTEPVLSPYLAINAVASIGEIVIGDEVTSVNAAMFSGFVGGDPSADALKKVTLGKKLLSIDETSFTGRNKIESIVIPKENTNFELLEGILYNKEKTVPLVITTGVSSYVELPDTVQKIPAFFDFAGQNISKIKIGKSIKDFGPMAFYYAMGLKEVEVVDDNLVYTTVQEDGTGMEALPFITGAKLIIHTNSGSTTEAIVKIINEQIYGSGMIAIKPLCLHENVTNDAGKKPTCTTQGFTPGVYCNDCKCWLKGHTPLSQKHVDKNSDGLCDICGRIANDIELNLPLKINGKYDYYANSVEWNWQKFKAPIGGSYNITFEDAEQNMETVVQGCVVKTNDIANFDINYLKDGEEIVAQAYNRTYKASAKFNAVEGETYYIGVLQDNDNWYYGVFNYQTDVTLVSLDCKHEHTIIEKEGVTPTACNKPGKAPVEFCAECNSYVHSGETVYLPHKDANYDLVCDICGEKLGTVKPGIPLDIIGAKTNTKYVFDYYAPITSTYAFNCYYMKTTITNYDGTKTYVDGELPNDDGKVLANLEGGKLYKLIFVYDYSETIELGDIQLISKIENCPHSDVVYQEEPIPPVDCVTPGRAGVATCKICNEVAHNNELIYGEHKDADGNNICDVCGNSLESEIFPNQVTPVTINNKEYTYKKFVCTKAGRYYFSIESATGRYIYATIACADENKNILTSYTSSSPSIGWDLEAGKTYYFGAISDYSYDTLYVNFNLS